MEKKKKKKAKSKPHQEKRTFFLKKILDFRKFEKGKRTQFILNMAAGLLIVLLMHGLESTRWGEAFLNNAFDQFIKSEAKGAVKTDVDLGDLLIIDVRYHKEKEKKEKEEEQKINYLSPRHTIARLLEMALAGDARVIVLDFSFEEDDCCHPNRDHRLQKVLADNKNKKTKIIFPTRIGHGNKVKKLIFDQQIDKNPNYVRAIPTLYASPDDAIARHWKAFKRYDGYKIFWSIPVLAVAMHKGKHDQLEKLESLVIQKDKKINVYAMDIETQGQKKKMLLPIQKIDHYLQRIRFRLIPADCIDGTPSGNVPIHHLTTELFKNKIVIIGNSDPEIVDLISTPVGHMPDMFIQANAIYTLLNGLQPKRTSWWVALFIDLFIIGCAAYLFHYMDSFWKDFLIAVVGVVVLGIIGYFCFFKSFGIFPNFVFGITAIGYIELMNSAKDYFTQRKKNN